MDKESIKKDLDLSISDKNEDEKYIAKLRKSTDKVKYLRIIKRYTQAEAAEIIGISIRQVQRLERRI